MRTLLFVISMTLGGLLMGSPGSAQVVEPPPPDMTDEYGEPFDLPVVKLAERYWNPLMQQLTRIETTCAGGETTGAVRPGKKPKWKPPKADRVHPRTGLPLGKPAPAPAPEPPPVP